MANFSKIKENNRKRTLGRMVQVIHVPEFIIDPKTHKTVKNPAFKGKHTVQIRHQPLKGR